MSKIADLIFENEEASQRTIRLVASENLPHFEARIPYLLDLYARYAFSGEHDETTGFFPQYNLREIENRTKEYLNQCLGAEFVNVRPLSGMNCMLTAIAAFARQGDHVMSLDPACGGHGETGKIFQKLGLVQHTLPFNRKSWSIDLEALKQYEHRDKIRMVYLDLCMILFPQPLKEIREIMPKGTIIIYDASHVLGLICGGHFQDPLREGADLLIGSTHKTFPGPHKGIIATNRYLHSIKVDAVSYHFSSHHHIADVACLGLVLENGLPYFKEYAKNVIDNAQYLGFLLANKEVKVEFAKEGFTRTHQIWLDCGDLENVNRATESLYKLNIIVNSIKIPTLDGRWGIRIGTQEISHLKITKSGIEILAEIISDVIHDTVPYADLKKKVDTLIDNHFLDFLHNKEMLDRMRSLLETYSKTDSYAPR